VQGRGCAIVNDDGDEGCTGNRMVRWAWAPSLPEIVPMFTYQSCRCVEMTALLMGVLRPTPVPTGEGLALVAHALRVLTIRIRRAYPALAPQSYEEVIASYDGPKRAAYARAAASLAEFPVRKRDAFVKAFVKADKRLLTKPGKPRMIQHRDRRYALELQCYIRPFSKAAQHMLGASLASPKLRFSIDGMNRYEQCNLIREKFEAISDCCILALDCVAFDESVAPEALKLEAGVYLACFAQDPKLRRLLRWQQRNRGRTAHGIGYRTYGRRMSGDANTSCGNWLLSFANVYSFARVAKLTRWDCIVCGDDVLIFCKRAEMPRLQEVIPEVAQSIGHRISVVADVVDDWRRVTSGKSRPIPAARGWLLVRSPVLEMSAAFMSHRLFQQPKTAKRAARTLAQGLLASNQGVPVIQALAMGVLKTVGDVPLWMEVFDAYEKRQLELGDYASVRWQDATAVAPTAEARQYYAEHFGINVDRQLELEERFANGVEIGVDYETLMPYWVAGQSACYLVDYPSREWPVGLR